jgi:ABC-type proline/glycine betaine transport system permease subunit
MLGLALSLTLWIFAFSTRQAGLDYGDKLFILASDFVVLSFLNRSWKQKVGGFLGLASIVVFGRWSENGSTIALYVVASGAWFYYSWMFLAGGLFLWFLGKFFTRPKAT